MSPVGIDNDRPFNTAVEDSVDGREDDTENLHRSMLGLQCAIIFTVNNNRDFHIFFFSFLYIYHAIWYMKSTNAISRKTVYPCRSCESF